MLTITLRTFFILLSVVLANGIIAAQIARDNFEGTALSSEWPILSGSEKSRISLDARQGYLRLKGSAVTLDDTEVKPVFLSRPVIVDRFEAATNIDFDAVGMPDTAGIDIRRDARYHYEFGIRPTASGREVYLRFVIGSVKTIAAVESIPPLGPVTLHIAAFPKYYRFAYRGRGGGELNYVGGVEAIPRLGKPQDSPIQIGIFASGNGRESSSKADFDWFEFNSKPSDPYADVVLTDPNLPPGYTIFSVASAEKGIIEKYPFVTRPSSFVPSNVESHRSLVYAKYGERSMHLDLFKPKGSSRRPAVIVVHGGAWITGHHTMENPLAIALAKCGYVAVTVEYRLSNEKKYPAQIHDLKASVRWLRANAGKYGIDMKRIGAVGASSGGHLVALLGSTNGIARFEGNGGGKEFSSTVQAVVDIDGTATLVDEGNILKEIKGPWDTNTKLTGFTYAENPEIWRDASPITHTNRMSAPTLFLNSSSFRPFQQREEMSAKLLRLGIVSEIVVVPDTPHPFWLFRPWFDTTVENIDRYFKRTMSRR